MPARLSQVTEGISMTTINLSKRIKTWV